MVWLMLFLVLSGCDNDKKRPLDNIITKGRVQFKILNTEFDIPAKYLQGGARTRDKVLETVNLWALLPNFEGYDKNVNYHDFVEVYHQGKRIKIMLITRGRRMTVPQIVERKNVKKNISVLGGKHQGGKYDEIRYGLEYYHSDFNGQDSIYLHRKNDIPNVFFMCAEDPRVPYPGCRGRWDYNDDVAVNFHFGIKYLPDWRNIMIKLQQLLDGQLNNSIWNT